LDKRREEKKEGRKERKGQQRWKESEERL